MKWQRIETAEKSDKPRLLCVAGYEPAVGRWREDFGWTYIQPEDFQTEEDWDAYAASSGVWEPTHWMPLPPAPEADNAE